ncbi:hypothetical protein HYV10_02940 [Candidatus Dependentiae bacterium]|nr:hypothetical protein [Candidatus Dependentiae bacterium]
MKSLKYALIGLLIVTVCKKLVPNEPKLDEQSHTIQNLSATLPVKNHRNRHNDRDKRHKKRFRSTVKKYNPDTKTAQVDNIYVGVYEYKQATTPPNITIPAMVPFGTITKKQSSKKNILTEENRFNITTLWGIPVHGHRKPIKESERNLTIGYLWLNQDSIFGIAQMTDGKTFVGVIDDHQPNYINTEKPRPGKTGPVWTWYTGEDSKDLQEKYGILKPSFKAVKEIGIAKINRQRYKLYGIEIPNLDLVPNVSSRNTYNSFSPMLTNSLKFNSLRQNPFGLQGTKDNSKIIHPLILSLLAKNWYNKNN